MTTDPDELALLGAVTADPLDDLPRLVYADWLDNRATPLPCPDCWVVPPEFEHLKSRIDELMSGGAFGDGIGPTNTSRELAVGFGFHLPGETVHAIWQKGQPWQVEKCDRCRGRGVLSDGRPERAELIRLQCNLAADPRRMRCECTSCLDPSGRQTICRFAMRVRELLEDWGVPWLGLANPNVWGAGVCGVKSGAFPLDTETIVVPMNSTRVPVAFYHRGFVERVRLLTLTFVGDECVRCGGTGRLWDVSGPACSECHGGGRVLSVAGELFHNNPTIRLVHLFDRVPSWHHGTAAWIPDETPDVSGNVTERVPACLFTHMVDSYHRRTRVDGITYPAYSDAEIDLYVKAAVRFGTDQAAAYARSLADV